MGPEEIDRVLDEHRSFVKLQLATDLIVVGHELDRDEPRAIDDWLAKGGGEVWWVHPEPPAQDLIHRSRRAAASPSSAARSREIRRRSSASSTSISSASPPSSSGLRGNEPR